MGRFVRSASHRAQARRAARYYRNSWWDSNVYRNEKAGLSSRNPRGRFDWSFYCYINLEIKQKESCRIGEDYRYQ